jgi:cysteinyl-tRNA synthetase
MALKLYNTMGRTLQEFKPIREGFVGFYGCGPTVYNYAHIGNLRAYVFLDTLDRTLTFLGYEKKHVMNITDIGHLTGDADEGEDKMLKTARERHQSVMEVAKFYTDAFFNDIDRLNIIRPDVVCRATEHVEDMIDLIRRIEANGHTYFSGGNLYFDVTTYPDYGKLACLNLDELKAGAGKRDVVVVDENKRNPCDFVLWFTKSKFENQALVWDSPWGKGYPGWHIECSAMSMKYLGEQFDIHTGGIDHVPIHHTNEIAQSEGATGKKWVNYWLHNEFLVVAKDKNSAENDGEKMSKSHGNFLTLQSLVDKGYNPLDYRYFLLGGHYRKQIYFSWDAMDGAKNARASLVQKIAKIFKAAQNFSAKKTFAKGEAADCSALSARAAEYVQKFREAMENDLSTPVALSCLQKAVKDSQLSPDEAADLVCRMDGVLGLDLANSAEKILSDEKNPVQAENHADDPESAEIDSLVAERTEAKKAKNFARADEIRSILSARGISIIDTPRGTSWTRK